MISTRAAAAASIALTAAVAALLLAVPALAFQPVTDDFGSPGRSELSWERCAGRAVVFSGSTLRVDLRSEDFAAAFLGNEAWEDYTVTGRFRWAPGGRQPSLEVLVRAQGRGCVEDQASAYRIVHHPGEGVVEVLSSDGFKHELIASEPHAFEAGIWYDFSLTVRGTSLDYWLHGKKLLHLDELEKHPRGRVGLGASRRSAVVSGTGEFDDLFVMASLGPLGSVDLE